MGYVQTETKRGWGLAGARRAGRWSAKRKVSVVLELLADHFGWAESELPLYARL